MDKHPSPSLSPVQRSLPGGAALFLQQSKHSHLNYFMSAFGSHRGRDPVPRNTMSSQQIAPLVY